MITGKEIVFFIVCMVFVALVFVAKSRKHARDHLIDLRRNRKPSTPPTKE